jgi:hypothetical protein
MTTERCRFVNVKQIYATDRQKERRVFTESGLASSSIKPFGSRFISIALGMAIALTATGRVSAQYGGGTGGTGGGTGGGTYKAPGGGYGSSGKAIGIGVGAAAGAGLLFLALRHTSMTGCVQPAEDGLRFVDEKKKASYTLVSGGVPLKEGQRAELQGKKTKDAAGAQMFTVKKLVKDLGSCEQPAPSAQAQPSAP